MNPKVKNFFLIVLKNAVNAILTNAALMAMLPSVFTLHTADGWWNLAKVTGAVIGAREVAVWLPIVLAWSKTSADPSLPPAQVNSLAVEVKSEKSAK